MYIYTYTRIYIIKNTTEGRALREAKMHVDGYSGSRLVLLWHRSPVWEKAGERARRSAGEWGHHTHASIHTRVRSRTHTHTRTHILWGQHTRSTLYEWVMLQCVVVCCSAYEWIMLQCVTVCCSTYECVTLQCGLMCCSMMCRRLMFHPLWSCVRTSHVAECCSVLQCVFCNGLQCVAVRMKEASCSLLQCIALWRRAGIDVSNLLVTCMNQLHHAYE